MARGVMTVPIDHIDCWIFDLDNTLYHPSARLFDLIDARMGAFIMRLMGVDAIEDVDALLEAQGIGRDNPEGAGPSVETE